MSDQPVKLMIAVYQDESSAQKAFAELKENAKAKHVGLKNAALVEHAVDGKLHIKEVHEFNAGKGAGWGLVLGGVAGLLTGGAALVLGAAGAAAGAVIGKVVDKEIPKHQLEFLGQALTPGTSALMVIAEQGSAEAVEQELTAAGGVIKTTELQAQIAEQVQAATTVEAPTGDITDPSQGEKLSTMARTISTEAGGLPY
ncbi:MAG: DUF1269 domain-containing protein [Anaerolineales bacterium]|nr:DUF1269 domain-containing protein [Anaerolineales bacterium]